MATIEELNAEIARLEREKQQAAREKRDAEERAQRQAEDNFIKREGVHVGCADDYATLTVGHFTAIYRDMDKPNPLDFYFGYERTVCLVHGNDSDDCDHEDDCKSEWAFVVKENGVETFRLPEGALSPEARNIEQQLLSGIGIWLGRRAKEEKPDES